MDEKTIAAALKALAPFRVDMPAVEFDGWVFPAGKFLDTKEPKVQKFAYDLLVAGFSWGRAMNVGGTSVIAGNKAKCAPDRAFVSSRAVVAAARAWRAADKDARPDWVKPRKPVAPVLAATAKAS